MRTPTQALLIALLLSGCNGSRRVRAPESESGATTPPTETAASESKPADKPSTPTEASTASEAEDRSGFDADMARIVLERARKQAVQCPTVVATTPTGEGDIEVVFDGPSGKLVDVVLGTTFATGSADGQSCLKNAFLGQIVTRFEGKKKLSYTLNVPAPPAPEKGAEKGAKKKP